MIERLRQLSTHAPVVVAHRGKSDTHPENTIPAFQAAIDCGAQMIEFDVRQTRDGEWVCLHDATLDRTTDGAQALGKRNVHVDEVNAAMLKDLDAGSWKAPEFDGTGIPTLRDTLALTHKARCLAMVEHKSGSAAAIVALLREMELSEHVLVQSFDWAFIREVHRLDPSIALGLIGPNAECSDVDTLEVATVAAAGAGLVHWRADRLTIEGLEKLQASELLVCTYTTDADFSLIGQARAGVHMITTNRPSRMVALRDAGHLARR